MQSGFTFVVDSREKLVTKQRVKMHKIPHIVEALPCGDFALRQKSPYRDIVGIERKAIADLVQSIQTRYKYKPRLFDQVERMRKHYQYSWLMISGSLAEHKSKLKDIGLNINDSVIYGSLASIAVRDNFHILWLPDDDTLIDIAYRVCTKVSEGKYGIPTASRPKYIDYHPKKVLMHVPGITQVMAERLVTKFKPLGTIALCDENQLTSVDGIGPSKAKLISDLFNREW